MSTHLDLLAQLAATREADQRARLDVLIRGARP